MFLSCECCLLSGRGLSFEMIPRQTSSTECGVSIECDHEAPQGETTPHGGVGIGLIKQYTWCVQVLRSPKEAFAAAMQSGRERCEKCVCLQGDYVEKRLHFQLPVVSSFF